MLHLSFPTQRVSGVSKILNNKTKKMKKLFNLQVQEIVNFLLNNKKGDCLELSAGRESADNKSGFIDIPIYKDKNMKIIYSYLVVDEKTDDIIEQFFIYSNWWGKIKNSHFTIEGDRGNFRNTRCGVININELKDWNSGTSHQINNKNATVAIEIVDFASLTAYCQRVFKASPSYGEATVISESPNPWVEVEINMPTNRTYSAQGISKKDAGNRFAIEYAKDLKK